MRTRFLMELLRKKLFRVFGHFDFSLRRYVLIHFFGYCLSSLDIFFFFLFSQQLSLYHFFFVYLIANYMFRIFPRLKRTFNFFVLNEILNQTLSLLIIEQKPDHFFLIRALFSLFRVQSRRFKFVLFIHSVFALEHWRFLLLFVLY